MKRTEEFLDYLYTHLPDICLFWEDIIRAKNRLLKRWVKENGLSEKEAQKIDIEATKVIVDTREKKKKYIRDKKMSLAENLWFTCVYGYPSGGKCERGEVCVICPDFVEYTEYKPQPVKGNSERVEIYYKAPIEMLKDLLKEN